MSSKLSKMPNISIPRSRFKQDFNHATHLMHGFLTPIDAITVIPGDEYKLDMASLIRMSSPIVPFFGNVKMYVGAFFVPYRILLDDWEKFMGDPTNHDKIQTVVPVNPDSVQLPFWQDFYFKTGFTSNFRNATESLPVRLGKPIFSATPNIHLNGIYVNPLKEMAYYQIWNDHFRPSNLIAPVLLNKNVMGQGLSTIGTDIDGEQIRYYSPLKQVCKNYDYFTASTLSPQFGASVTLPLGTYAPVVGDTSMHSVGSSGLTFGFGTNTANPNYFLGTGDGVNTGATQLVGRSGATGQGDIVTRTNMVVDLQAATAATINSIRWAFQVQKYLERSNYGSKYFEILNAHYGITNPDSRMQRAERLGVHSFYINVNQVLSTAGQSSDASNKVGQLGAVSVTGDRSQLFNFAFSEFGCLMILVWTKFDRSYDGGIQRDDLYSKRLDYYTPEFANLGDQMTKELELHVYDNNNAVVDPKTAFGYQEAWAELRYRRDRISGILSKSSAAQWIAAGYSGTPAIMNFWTLADNFEGQTVGLDSSFLFEDRTALTSVLTSSSDGPDYICDFHLNYIKTAELPLYSIPGLIDHFGAL